MLGLRFAASGEQPPNEALQLAKRASPRHREPDSVWPVSKSNLGA